MVISPGGSGVEEGSLVVVQRLCWWPVGRWTANIDNAAPPARSQTTSAISTHSIVRDNPMDL